MYLHFIFYSFCKLIFCLKCTELPKCLHCNISSVQDFLYKFPFVKWEVSIFRISMSRVACLCLHVRVCVVWWYLCCLKLKKSLKVTFLWRGLKSPCTTSCLCKGWWVFVLQGVTRGVMLGWLHLLFSSQLSDKADKSATCSPHSPPILFYVLLSCLLCCFLILCFKLSSAGADCSLWNWPSNNVHF